MQEHSENAHEDPLSLQWRPVIPQSAAAACGACRPLVKGLEAFEQLGPHAAGH